MQKIDIPAGTVFGTWTVLGAGSAKRGMAHWEVRCGCGAIKEISGNSLLKGRSSSCHSCAHSKHRLTKTPAYRVWSDMKYRCSSSKHKQWKDYGGRGITVCKRWMIFENFFSDMGPPPTGMQLERKKNHLGYSKANCVWATRKQNMRNRRDTRFVEYQGERVSLAEASERSGLPHSTLTKRLNKADDQDLFRPADQTRKRKRTPEALAALRASNPLPDAQIERLGRI